MNARQAKQEYIAAKTPPYTEDRWVGKHKITVYPRWLWFWLLDEKMIYTSLQTSQNQTDEQISLVGHNKLRIFHWHMRGGKMKLVRHPEWIFFDFGSSRWPVKMIWCYVKISADGIMVGKFRFMFFTFYFTMEKVIET